MSNSDILHHVTGYDDALDEMARQSKKGSELTDLPEAVSNKIASLHPKRIFLKLAEVIEETPSTHTLRFVSQNGYLPSFQAGQYINLFVNIDGVSTARPYAISSGPLERDHYDITVKRVQGGFVSNYLIDHASAGMSFTSSGPMGNFFYNPLFHGDDLAFLAGGSGIAPARSMILDMASNISPPKLHVIYGSRSTDDIIFLKELDALEKKYDFLTVTHVISEPEAGYVGRTGFLTKELITEVTGDPLKKVFYICGPTAMNEFCLDALTKLGLPRKRIRIEANGPPKAPQGNPDWPQDVSPDLDVTVTVHGKGSFLAKTGEPLLNSLERNGYFAENACRSGECSLCRVKVLKGEVYDPPEAKLRASDRRFQWRHSCVAFPLTDIEILL